MKRFLIIIICLFSLSLLLVSCDGDAEGGDITVTIGGEKYYPEKDSIFDRTYTTEGKPSVFAVAKADGVAVTCYTTDGTDVITELIDVTVGRSVLIPTNGYVIFIDGASANGSVSVEGCSFLDVIPLTTAASITDESGKTGFLLSHKDPVSFDGVTNALISSSPTTAPLPENAFALHALRNAKGDFITQKTDVTKTSSKYFTIYLTDEYAKACAEAFMKQDNKYSLQNTSLISPYGDKPSVVFGDTVATITAVNPKESSDGVDLYDEASGLMLSPKREGEFIDVLVFDGIVTHIAKKNTRVVSPYPNGYLLCFNGSESVKKAERLSVGDKIETLIYEPKTTPKDYVLLGNKHIVETVFYNETRTSIALAVIYDGRYKQNSTGTNVWGVELAIDKEGKIVDITQMNVANSGNMTIPEGGYVLSAIESGYRTVMGRMKRGDSAEHIVKNGMYSFRKITEANFYKTGEGEYLSIYGSETKTTPVVSNAFELILDSDGFVVSTKEGGGTAVPDGGFVVSGIGIKNIELKRFYEDGCRVIFDESSGSIYLFGGDSIMLEKYTALLSESEKTLEKSLELLIPLDYEHAYSLLESAKSSLASGEPTDFFKAAEAIDELKNICVPSLAVQDRAAWVVGYDVDAADVKHTVEYAHSLGLNTLILSPYRDSYALWDTSVEHLSRHPELADDVDILQLYIDECHARGMKLIFMQCCFTTEKPSGDYPDSHYVNYYKDKLLISKTGRDVAYFYDSPSYTLNPYDSEVRQFTLDIIAEVLERYDVDGIQLDYIRFPLPTYYQLHNYEDHGYNADIIAAFQKEYNTSVNPKNINYNHELWEKWCQFRCDIITSFVCEVNSLTSSHGKNLTCTCFADATDRAKYVFQDVKAWADQGLIYGIYPMIYSPTLEGQKKYGDELKSIVGDDVRIILGIGTYDGETNEVIRDQVDYSFELGTEGNSIFALEYIQSFKFDKLYRDCLYRTPAVTTDSYGLTAKGYAEMLRFLVEKTYSYKYSEDYGALLRAIDELDSKHGTFDPSNKTVAEKQSYLTSLAADLRKISESLPSGSNVKEHLDGYVEMLATSLERTCRSLSSVSEED